ncbi:XRE family transcriptional regulator [Sphaerisporangium album]|uniref:XRE family transcriptional regulator n=1 Tax=Sphaerisporangium album TaxID=509200 RepID=A0A367ESL1_9ACTN|nr:helix-turn-helix transcriptional regulator [Sphaerisporangium album]RCG20963.1 XRE family transcriptional regulator [Sphaerisporangium album]
MVREGLVGRERNLDPNTSPRAFFGSELRRCRKRVGLSQPQLSERTTYSPDMIGKIERGERPPSPEFVQQCDEIFGEDGHFNRLYQFMLRTPGPAWFARWLEEIEPRATVLRTWDPLLVPGLLQTEAYARHIFSREPKISSDEVEERVQARMLRKTVLERGDPPAVWVLLDEGILRRSIGGPQITRAQLEYLLEISDRSNVVIQVVPFSAESTVGLTGAFILAELPGGEPDAVYIE